MTKNILKRTLAGMLAVLTVAATVPADVSWSELLGGTAIVASAETATAEFVKTTADTIGSDLKNNFVAVSEETVNAWKAENETALIAERAAAGKDSFVIIVYAIDGSSYKVKTLGSTGYWSNNTYALDGLKYEMNSFNSVVYYSTQTTTPFEEYPFTTDQFYYQFPSSVDVLKINKIEALVAIDKKPDWGLIQICDGSEIKQNYYMDLHNGVHKYVWDKNDPDNTVDGNGVYGQIMLSSEREGQYGSLVGYKLYMEGQNDPVEVGDWTYPISVVPTGLEAHCGDTLEDVELPNRSDNDQGTWSWKEPDTDVGDVGINTFTAVFTPADDSLKTVEFDVDVAVSKTDFTLEGAEGLVYDGKPHTLVKGDIPEGTKFSLTEPTSGLDYDAEMELIEPLRAKAYELFEKSSGNYDANYYYGAASTALKYYSNAIGALKEGNETLAADKLASAKANAEAMKKHDITPSEDVLDAIDYIEKHIIGEDFEALKARFEGDSTDWKDTAEATDAGDYTVWYKGTGNYSDTVKTVDVTIAKADLKVTAPKANDLTYNGKAQKLVTPGSVEKGTMQYAVTDTSVSSAPADGWSKDVPKKTKAGTYRVWYKGVADDSDNYNDSKPVCVTVKINRLSIKDAKVMVRNKTYTGKALKPGSKIIVNGKRLKKGRDYTITYKNNKNVGVGKAVIKGIGNYKGTVKTTFNVRPKKAAIKSVSSPKAKQLKVTWKKTPQATGYQIKVSTSKDFKIKNLVRNAFVKNNSTFSKTFAPLKSGKTYYVKVRAYKKVGSTNIYGQYSAVKTVTVK